MSSIALVAGTADGCVDLGRVACRVGDTRGAEGATLALDSALTETVPVIGGGVLSGARFG